MQQRQRNLTHERAASSFARGDLDRRLTELDQRLHALQETETGSCGSAESFGRRQCFGRVSMASPDTGNNSNEKPSRTSPPSRADLRSGATGPPLMR